MVVLADSDGRDTPPPLTGWVTVRPARSVRALLPQRQRHYARVHPGVVTFAPSETADPTLTAPLPALSVQLKRNHLVLRTPGLRLRISPDDASTLSEWSARLSANVQRRFLDEYELGDVLGTGSFASVHRATHLATGDEVAVKRIAMVSKRAQSSSQIAMEIRVMTMVRHPGLMPAREVFRDGAVVHIVMDLMPGGTLKEVVCDRAGRGANELDAAVGALQVLRALSHLHARGIAHRDVKLENVLCPERTLPARGVKLGDFGFAIDEARTPAVKRSSPVGTPVYVAPESARGEPHGTPVDVFAVGVLVFRMVASAYPYEGKDDRATMRAAAAGGPINFSGRAFADASGELVSFLKATLQPDPAKRLSADGAIMHPWLALARAEEAAAVTMRNVSVSSEEATETTEAADEGNTESARKRATKRWRKAVWAVAFLGRLRKPVDKEPRGSAVHQALRRLSLDGAAGMISFPLKRSTTRFGKSLRRRVGKERLGNPDGDGSARFQMPTLATDENGGDTSNDGTVFPMRVAPADPGT